MPPDLRIFDSLGELSQAAAEQVAARLQAAVRERGKFSIALSGGSTPKGLFTLLAGPQFASLPWDKVSFFWSDERHVPPDHPNSNYRMAKESLLSHIPAAAANVFRMKAEGNDADAVALDYERTLQSFFSLPPGKFPRFDLILLGMGPDGHTASLFPGSAALAEKSRLVVANWVAKFNTYRLTFTFPVLNQARCVMFLVAGQDKAAALEEVLENPATPLPAQLVQPSDGELLWMVDRAAAGQLRKSA